MLSNKLLQLSTEKQFKIFPETVKDKSWEKTEEKKKYFLNFPFYPFRTLNPRSLNLLASSTKSHESEYSTPLFPAHTQLNLVFQKRKKTNFLPNMLPYKLDASYGSSKKNLTDEQFKQATSFSVVTREDNADVTKNYNIKRVDIKVHDMYLQVKFFKNQKKFFSQTFFFAGTPIKV
jgi:hypothetical protein